jgi:hypothetical protein
MEIFAGAAMALYAAHHVGDYWVQTDHQARHKGDAGAGGRLVCAQHVLTYLMTQTAALLALSLVTATRLGTWQVLVALAISGVTHYAADRREHGLMYWLARRVPGKAAFLELGRPRTPRPLELWGPCSTCEGRGTSYDESTGGKCWDCHGTGQYPGVVELEDPPQLATGAWALDQAWHIFWGVFVAALVLSL